MPFPITQNSIVDLKSAVQNCQVNTADAEKGAVTYMKFSKGEFLLGKDLEDITGENIVINTATFKHGWMIWVKKKATKLAVSFIEPLPIKPEPVEIEVKGEKKLEEYTESRAFEARFLDPEDETVISFGASSFGARKACDVVLNAIKARANAGRDDLYPIVQLNAETYDHDDFGKIYNPVFTIVGWMDEQGNTTKDEMIADQTEAKELEGKVEPEPETGQKPTTRRRRKAQ